MSDQTLLTLLDEVRGKTLQAITGVEERQARWAPEGLQNTVLWHAGHSYIVVEWLVMQSLRREPICPVGWFEMFSWDSRPAQVPAEKWPSLAQVIAQLNEQHVRLRSILGELTDEQLSAPVTRRETRTARHYIVHALHDEACHCGEIWLLRKLLSRMKS